MDENQARDELQCKRSMPSDSELDIPLLQRKNPKKKVTKEPKYEEYMDDDEEEEKPKPTKMELDKKNSKVKSEPEEGPTPTKCKKKQDDEPEVWRWKEEKKKDDGTKWQFLEHKGPLFAPAYEPLPSDVRFFYDGKVVRLSQDTEEVAGFYARMLDYEYYTTKPTFNNNFFTDWRKVMTHEERETIKELSKCNFKEMHNYLNKNRAKEETNTYEEIQKEYGFCTIDGRKEKIRNCRIEPPGLFRPIYVEHPKMGMLKRRVMPEDVIINCSKDSKVPKPPAGHRWKGVKHDNTVTWLASWIENVQGKIKYVRLDPSCKLKGEMDWQKYETARKLHKCIDTIRNTYRSGWKAKEMRIRQHAVALYFIDRLALRAGNEKDDDQTDTVGCCSLRVEHIELYKEKDGKEYVVVFDFLGRDSIRYYNEVPVEKCVYKNLELFMKNKKDGDDLFDRLSTHRLNEHLKELMPGLTAEVFRTYNASITLQIQLDELTDGDATVPEKIHAYDEAILAVAILCNLRRAVPKDLSKFIYLEKEIQAARTQIAKAEEYEKKKKALEKLEEQLKELQRQETELLNKSFKPDSCKLYCDPRISVAWCKKYEIDIEKVFPKYLQDNFKWAIEMADPDFRFDEIND